MPHGNTQHIWRSNMGGPAQHTTIRAVRVSGNTAVMRCKERALFAVLEINNVLFIPQIECGVSEL